MHQDQFMDLSGQEFVPINIINEDPLDYLQEGLVLRRKTRSSMESNERRLEIPPCEPLFISTRRDSNRSRREPLSPQLSPMQRHSPSLHFNLIGEKPLNCAYALGSESMYRRRLPSETAHTCQSSSMQVGISNSGGSFGLANAPMFADELEANMMESDEGHGPGRAHGPQQLIFQEDLWMRDSMSIQDGVSIEVVPLEEDNGDVLQQLQPVSVPANNADSSNETSNDERVEIEIESVSSTMMFSMEQGPDQAPNISREGLRKQKSSQTASMIQHTVRRKKKTTEQVEYLKSLFFRLGGKWDGKIRKEAMQKTGLSRIQIYKWFFDMKLQQRPKEKKVSPEERVSYPSSIFEPTILGDDDSEAVTPRPIFKVEKVTRD